MQIGHEGLKEVGIGGQDSPLMGAFPSATGKGGLASRRSPGLESLRWAVAVRAELLRTFGKRGGV